MSSADAPDSIDPDKLDEYSDEEIAAYNEAKSKELDRQLEERRRELNEQEQEAVDALVGDAKESVKTETVTLESGLELDVRARIPPSVERMQTRLQRLEREGNIEQARQLNCEMLAAMVETSGYDSLDPWLIASQDDDAGMQWLGEATATILGPAADKAEETKGKLQR